MLPSCPHDPSPDVQISSDPTPNQIPVPYFNYTPAADASAAIIIYPIDRILRVLISCDVLGWVLDCHLVSLACAFFSPFMGLIQAQRQLAVKSGSRLEIIAGTIDEEEDEDHLEEIEIDDEAFTSTITTLPLRKPPALYFVPLLCMYSWCCWYYMCLVTHLRLRISF